MAREVIWPTWAVMHGAGENDDRDPKPWREAVTTVGQEVIARSAVVIYSESFMHNYLGSLWELAGTDKQSMIPGLEALAWASFADDRIKKDAVDRIHRDFRKWESNKKRDIQRNREGAKPEHLKHVDRIEELFGTLREMNRVDPSQSPGALTAALVDLEMADRRNDVKAYNDAAEKVHAAATGSDSDKPFAGSALLRLLAPAPDHLGSIQVQVRALDHLGEQGVGMLETAARRLFDNSHDWPWRIRSEDQDAALAVNTVLAKHLEREVSQGRLPRGLFDYWRQTRDGRNWIAKGRGADLMATIIEKELLAKTAPESYRYNPAVACAKIVREEFESLHDRFPPATWFDDRVVAAMQRNGWADIDYFRGGHDRQKKVVDAAARLFAKCDRLPFGYDGKPAYSRDAYRDWIDRILKDASDQEREAMVDAAEAAYPKRIDDLARGDRWFREWDFSDQPEARERYFTALAKYIPRLADAPNRPQLPEMDALDTVDADSYSVEETDRLLHLFTYAPATYDKYREPDQGARMVMRSLMAQGRQQRIFEVIPELWRIARDIGNDHYSRWLADTASEQLDADEFELAHAMAAAGLQIAKGRLDGDVRKQLETVLRRARGSVGQRNPYQKGDPRWPVAEAQRLWQMERVDSAWDYYSQAGVAAQTVEMLAELNPQFPLWVIHRNIKIERHEAAEELARQMTLTFDQRDPGAELRARLALLLADIAFARKEYPSARAQYRAIAESQEFADTRARLDAELGMGNVDRKTGRTDMARDIFTGILERPDERSQAEGMYHLALTQYDEENYDEAEETLVKLLRAFPYHVEGKLLKGDVQLELGKFGNAMFLDISSIVTQSVLKPGEPFRAEMIDTNKVLVKHARSIELRVWTEKSGDEERLMLTLTGDSNDRFSGSLSTALGSASPGNETLEVFGNDVVHFDFTDEFKRDIRHEGPDNEATLSVVSNATLSASSGAILSKEEIEREQLRQAVLARQGVHEETDVKALSEVRAANQVRPGNNVNIRLLDLDRSVSGDPDVVVVSAECASGDRVSALELRETGPSTGVFEGALKTAPRPATAFASDSSTGTNPNAVISPSADLPAWVAGRTGDKSKLFGIDMNALVDMATMRIVGEDPQRAITGFVVQTSLNNRDFTTVAAHPEPHQPWNGELQAAVIPWWGPMPSSRDEGVAALRQQFEVFYRLKGETGKIDFTPAAETMKVTWDADMAGPWKRLEKAHKPGAYLLRCRTAFYVDQRQTRTFTLDPLHGLGGGEKSRRDEASGPAFAFFIDGVPAPTSAQAEGDVPHQLRIELAKGVHVMEAYALSDDRNLKKGMFQVTWDTAREPFAEVVPDFHEDPKAKIVIGGSFVAKAPTIEAQSQGDYAIDFQGRQARVVRFWLLNYKGDAPAIKKITLDDVSGEQVLPIAQDYTVLRENQQLEIIPGDTMTVTYKDPTVIGDSRNLHEQRLDATFTNGTIRVATMRLEDTSGGQQRRTYVGLRRFEADDQIRVFISDADFDVSDDFDTVEYTATTSEGRSVTIEARETEAHSGVFLGSFFPVTSQAQRKDQLQIAEHDDITVSYLDKENTDQGIPWKRTALIEQVVWTEPELRVHDVSSRPLAAVDGAEDEDEDEEKLTSYDEQVRPRFELIVERPEAPNGDRPATVVLGGPVIAEVVWPTNAKATDSTATLYAQTSSGRTMAGVSATDGFDTSVPGTIALSTGPSAASVKSGVGQAYASITSVGTRLVGDPLDVGLFAVNIPVELGDCPESSLVDAPPTDLAAGPPTLKVTAGDTIFIGFRYEDENGTERWLTAEARLAGDALFDVMDRRYAEPVTGIYVGDRFYMRVIDPLRDVSGEKDRVVVEFTRDGATIGQAELVETLSHSGVFKGRVTVTHADEDGGEDQLNAIPARYGDRFTVSYTGGATPIEHQIEVHRGADGEVLPFTKRFKDPDIAVRTQFSIAEAHFEMAKKHRALAKDAAKSNNKEQEQRLLAVSRTEIALAKKLLDEALRDFPDNTIRAQSDYLLAELEMEYGNDAATEEAKQKAYDRAINKFANIVANYPENEYAPRAQFKKALAYHKKGKLKRASEEYVKLSYQYPDSEYVAETIAHLGRYYLTKGALLSRQAEKVKDPVEAEQLRLKAKAEFETAGSVFAKLKERFPTHSLASKTTVLAGMCLMRAGAWDMAIEKLDSVVDNTELDAPQLKAEAMYWKGDTLLRKIAAGQGGSDDAPEAYRTFKQLVWDYPDTKWAKYARGRLIDEDSLQGVEE
ncbi:MAG: tetratricopeptide repeat protein [Planctomycetota bacterium]